MFRTGITICPVQPCDLLSVTTTGDYARAVTILATNITTLLLLCPPTCKFTATTNKVIRI